jgi:type IV pilus assembly protein PilY1
MNRITLKTLTLSTFCATFSYLPHASAQSDIAGAAPNVLLLVDTSGSMEYMTSAVGQPTCDPNSSANSQKSRWVNLVEVLTGSINDYRCVTVDRSSSAFVSAYSLGGKRPADFAYSIPYHRPMSGNCIVGPGTINLSSNAFAIDDGVNGTRVSYTQYGTTNSCTFSQNTSDGLLSTYASKVRFGLMTFDTNTSSKTGYSGTAADSAGGIAGTWSYFVAGAGGSGLGGAYQGKPGGCPDLADFEVGARNAAAPPWEGRMVAFGDPSPNPSDPNDNPTTRAQWIREILLATRPFNATPIAGMLDDARAFLWSDKSKDPLDTTGKKDFGPYNDDYVKGGCRQNTIVLLTDGEPNLDLRAECEKAGGACPYDPSYKIAHDLYNQPGYKQVQTFVIGFAVSLVKMPDGSYKDCRTLTSKDVDLTDSSSFCSLNSGNAALHACCVLDQIAYNGGTDHAYFADNTTELRAALSSVLSSISKNTTSRTWPVMSAAAGTATGSGNAAGYRFYTSFKPRLDLSSAGLWSGVIERNRFVCQTQTGSPPQAVLQKVDRSAGDEFADNVNSGNGTSDRQFYTFIGSTENGAIPSTGILRPNLTVDDGAGVHTGRQWGGDLDFILTKVDPLAMNVTDSTCATDSPALAATPCAAARLGWLLGKPYTSKSTTYARCAHVGSSDCSLVADVYHSTPVIVNHPTDAPRDETYQAFAAAWAQRPLMLYTSTNDGLLHGFKVATNYANPGDDTLAVNTLANNELWAYLPPAVLPDVVSEYPGTHLELLDGAPVVSNIVATPVSGRLNGDGTHMYAFERTADSFASATAVGGNASATTWRTVLVQAFGKHRGGYFALDITNPDLASKSPYYSQDRGPEFLWQLTENSTNRWLFGPSGATPLITTLFFAPSASDSVAREIPVAILPGGNADPDATGNVQRGNTTPSGIPTGFNVRTSVPKYSSMGALAARSLTIVRLDTGEIVRTFRRSKTEGNIPTTIQSRVIEAPIDSPITGQPVAYPALVGSIADRVFVGDRDGGLWRVDLSSTEPSNWTMKLFFDAYAGQDARAGQPVVTQPQLSVDDLGQVTIAFSTGSQDDFSANNAMINYVWSLTESVDWSNKAFSASVNWYRRFNNGERVVGPLQLFASGLYFATYQPDSGATACGVGTSRVWGMHYHDLVDSGGLDKDNPPVSPSDSVEKSRGGRPWLPENGTSTTTRVQFLDNTISLLAGATIFGVAVAQVPSCVDNSSPTDSFFGSGVVHTTMPNVTPATYELVMQTGASGKSSVSSAATNVTTLNLPSPDNSPRIASWATIME